MRKRHELQIRLQRCGLHLWQGAANIDTFSNTRLQQNCHSAVWVDPKNVKGTSSFGFKFAIERFVILKDLLTNLVVIFDSLFIGTKQSMIDQLLSLWQDGLPISKERNFEKHVSRESKSSRSGLQCGWDCRLKGMHRIGQGIIHKQHSFATWLWRLGKH